MNRPEYVVRCEVAQTDDEHTREFHVVLGGAQRGGLSVMHGYFPDQGPELMGYVDEILEKMRTLLEAYACTLNPVQLELLLP